MTLKKLVIDVQITESDVHKQIEITNIIRKAPHAYIRAFGNILKTSFCLREDELEANIKKLEVIMQLRDMGKCVLEYDEEVAQNISV